MNGVIRLLSDNMSNMIAAGEVIERPCSVVKELVENSLDAKSTRIEINLLESGIKEIMVIDNGIGMTKEDIKMSFKRHATSKIYHERDLFNLHTLGFRGEAIPSIASISKISIASKKIDDSGYEIVNKASNIILEQAKAMNEGTIVTVNQLFFNTPARLKYLKSLQYELAIIVDTVERLALANPNVSFKLTNDKKMILKTSGNNNMTELISNIYGIEVAKNLLEIKNEDFCIKINCFVSNFNIYKSKKTYINLIVNNRIIKNYNLSEKIISLYQGFIPLKSYPVAIVFINVDPFLIDVNIHPTKKEIKFSNEAQILALLEKSIKEKLLKYNPLLNTLNSLSDENEIINNSIKDTTYIDNFNLNLNQDIIKENNNKFDKVDNIYQTKEKNKSTINDTIFNRPKAKLPFLEYIGQYRGTYLLFQDDMALYLIDQHAAQERIKYENCLSWLDNISKEKQELLIPLSFETSLSEAIFIKENLKEIENLGIEIEESGSSSFFIRKIPLWFKDDLENNIELLLGYLYSKKSFSIFEFKDDLAKTLACKASVKANHFLNKSEALKLIEDLNKCANPFSCPHGRPVFVKITNYEMEKLFKRVV